jgi:SAM-dependent methyltransferase
MKKLLIKIYNTLKFFGFDVRVLIDNTRGLGFYFRDFVNLKKQKGSDSKFYFRENYPILNERFSESGKMSGHYFHQDLLVATKIFENRPVRHIDIGSRTDGFIAHLAVFREVEIIDIRDQVSSVKNILFRKADLMKLPDDLINCCDSISSLHVIEHFGLGRYGDPIDYNGHLKAIENIGKALKEGGKFYFSTPIGDQRIEFNAHRVFAVNYLMELFKSNFTIDSFSYVNDKGELFENVKLDQENIKINFECHYGCGIFELTKKSFLAS